MIRFVKPATTLFALSVFSIARSEEIVVGTVVFAKSADVVVKTEGDNVVKAADGYSRYMTVKDIKGDALLVRGTFPSTSGWLRAADVLPPNAAIAHFSEILRVNSSNIFALESRCEAYRAVPDYDRHLEDATALCKLEPKEPKRYNILGHAWMLKGDLGQSCAIYRLAIQAFPQNKQTYLYNLATAQWNLGDYAGAISTRRDVIQQYPDNEAGWHNLAEYLSTCPDEKLVNGIEAVRAAKRACELTAWKDASNLTMLAMAHAAAENWDSAVDYQTKSIAIAPSLTGYFKLTPQQLLELFRSKKRYIFVPPMRS